MAGLEDIEAQDLAISLRFFFHFLSILIKRFDDYEANLVVTNRV